MRNTLQILDCIYECVPVGVTKITNIIFIYVHVVRTRQGADYYILNPSWKKSRPENKCVFFLFKTVHKFDHTGLF